MAKQESGEKTNLYLLAIVGIVAVVGIVVLNSSGTGSVSWSSDDLSGQAVKVSNSELKKLKYLEKLEAEFQAIREDLDTTNEDNPLCPAPCGSTMATWCGQTC